MASCMVFKGKEGFSYVLICFVCVHHTQFPHSPAENKTTKTSQAWPAHLFSRPCTTISPLDFLVFQFYSIPCEILHLPPTHFLGENHCGSGGAGNFSWSWFEIFTQCSDRHFPKHPGGWGNQFFKLLFLSISHGCSSNKLLINKFSAPSPPWIELCVLGGVLVTSSRRLLPSLFQRVSLSLFELTVGVIPVSLCKSRSLLLIPR